MSKPSRRRQPLVSPAGTPAATPGAGRPRTPVPSTSPSGSARAGRRERARAAYKPSFMERNRTPIVVLAAVAGIVLISAFVFASAASPAYACTQVWTPAATPSPAAGASPNPGFVQPDMGQAHRGSGGEKVTYTYCPPASGPHYQSPGGPITPRFYGPGDRALPEGWVHNLEHGAMVILYRGRDGDPGVTEAGQSALRGLFEEFPASPVCNIQPGTTQGPVFARFDDMATQYAALVWGRVLPLETLDTAQILELWQIWGERTSPERQCTPVAESPAPTVETSPAPSSEPSAAPGAAVSAAPSVETSPAASPS